MSKSTNDSLYIPDERFSCQSCGRCCTRWTITLDETKVEQLSKHEWGTKPFIRRKGLGDTHAIRMVNQRCFFLDDQRKCRIHTELGYADKPDGCKAFPLHVTHLAGKHYVRLSFYCPAVIAEQGKRLSEQYRWVKETIKGAGEVSRKTPLCLVDNLPLSLIALDRLDTLIVNLLGQTNHRLHDRITMVAALLFQLAKTNQEQMGKGEKSAAEGLLREKQNEPLASLAQVLLHESEKIIPATKAGPVFSLFLGTDCAPSSWARLAHFFGVRFFQLGLIPLHSYLLSAKASAKSIAQIKFDLSAEATDLITRYLIHKIKARRILGNELSYVAGMNTLVMAYGIIHLFSRLHAAKHQRTNCSEEDVRQALPAADLLVLEHNTLLGESVFGSLTERLFAQPDVAFSILRWLEPAK